MSLEDWQIITFSYLYNERLKLCGEIKTSQAEKPPRKRAQAAELYFRYIKGWVVYHWTTTVQEGRGSYGQFD